MEVLGPILLVITIPMVFRWVPPNRFYGFRVPATLGNPSLCYDVNALAGRHFFLLGVLMVVLEFLLPIRLRVTVIDVVGWIGLLGIMVADWRTANRWRREREP